VLSILALLALPSLAAVGKVLLFLLMLSVLVVLHEYGHFIVARRNGVRVNEFAVGMGPKLTGWTSPRSGTLYSLRLLPIGGYCAMEGEDGKTSEAEQQREFRDVGAAQPTSSVNFQAKSTWARLAIVLAGPVANFILAFVILLIGAFTFGVATDNAPPSVRQVTPGLPAARAGVQPGDLILSIDGVKTGDVGKLMDTLHRSRGQQKTIVFQRGDVQKTLLLTPGACPDNKDPKIGCVGILLNSGYLHESFGATLRDAALQYGFIADNTVSSIGLLVTKFTQYAPQVSGVIGMGQVATTIQDYGWAPYFTLAAAISFALGLFNLLPIPALDGGRAAFIIAEMLRGKPVDPEKEALVHLAGFAALIGLMIVVAFHDIAKIASGQGVF
jgi:regulator of sigma E protease